MIKQILAVGVILLSASNAQADAIHRNPAQSAELPNMTTFGKTSIPIGAYEYCERYNDRCADSSATNVIDLTQDIWSRIVKVNYRVNSVFEPKTDMEIFGVEERWELPSEAADCEDFVLEKRRQLSDMGVPVGAMRVTVVYDANNGGHAVLTVITDRGDFILDNVEQKVLRWQEAELTYIKRQAPGDLMRWESLRPS